MDKPLPELGRTRVGFSLEHVAHLLHKLADLNLTDDEYKKYIDGATFIQVNNLFYGDVN